MYKILFEDDWAVNYKKYDLFLQQRIMKKIEKQQTEQKVRHLKHGVEFYVLEVGQYRCAIKTNETLQTKTICFVGNHKQYEKWYKEAQE